MQYSITCQVQYLAGICNNHFSAGPCRGELMQLRPRPAETIGVFSGVIAPLPLERVDPLGKQIKASPSTCANLPPTNLLDYFLGSPGLNQPEWRPSNAAPTLQRHMVPNCWKILLKPSGTPVKQVVVFSRCLAYWDAILQMGISMFNTWSLVRDEFPPGISIGVLDPIPVNPGALLLRL